MNLTKSDYLAIAQALKAREQAETVRRPTEHVADAPRLYWQRVELMAAMFAREDAHFIVTDFLDAAKL